MRSSFTFVLLFSLLAVCVSARWSNPSTSLVELNPLGVAVPYKWCGSSSDDATIDSIVSNEFPPVKGDTLVLNVTGNLTKVVTAGTYKISITVSGIPLPDITGDISDFRALPWQLGELNFTYSQEIPSEAPSGSYTVKISAEDQDKKQIFCISIAFSLSAQPGQPDIRLSSAVRKADDAEADATIAFEASSRPISGLRVPAANNRGVRAQLTMPSMPTMKPMKGGKRNL